MNIQEQARHAELILSNPIFKSAFEILDAHYKDRIVATSADQAADREHFYRCSLALKDVKSSLTAILQTGKLEMVTATKKEKARK